MGVLAAVSSAFVLGLGSTGHCLVMCGPLQAVWLPRKKPLAFVLYHGARTLVYVSIALLFHHFQGLLHLPQWSSNSTLLLGLSLLMGVMLYVAVEYFLPRDWTRLLVKLSSRAGKLPPVAKAISFGLLNGLLPCGMVWMAAGVAAPHEPTTVALLMLVFSLGTLPGLSAVPLVRSLFSRVYANLPTGSFRKWTVPALILATGLILTFRGFSYQQSLNTVDNAHDPTQLCTPPQ